VYSRRVRRFASTAAACSLVALVSTRAHAGAEESIRIDYRAPAGCPNDAAFAADVRARTTRWRIETGDAPARHFVIEVAPRGPRVHGRLLVTDVGGESTVREVDGDTCDEVAEALALMTALAIDPHASLVPISRPAPPPPPPPPPPPAVATTNAPVFESTPDAHSTRWRLAAGAHAGAAGGVAPMLAAGMDAFVDAALARGSAWSPGVRLRLAYNEALPVSTTAGTAKFWRLVGGLAVCPLRLDVIPSTLALVPCGAFDAGEVDATGTDTPNGRHERRTWLDVGAVGRLDWALSAYVSIEIEGGALFPLLRYHSTFPTLAVYDTPFVAGFAGAGAAVRFW
jgi:hypothetical protein